MEDEQEKILEGSFWATGPGIGLFLVVFILLFVLFSYFLHLTLDVVPILFLSFLALVISVLLYRFVVTRAIEINHKKILFGYPGVYFTVVTLIALGHLLYFISNISELPEETDLLLGLFIIPSLALLAALDPFIGSFATIALPNLLLLFFAYRYMTKGQNLSWFFLFYLISIILDLGIIELLLAFASIS